MTKFIEIIDKQNRIVLIQVGAIICISLDHNKPGMDTVIELSGPEPFQLRTLESTASISKRLAESGEAFIIYAPGSKIRNE